MNDAPARKLWSRPDPDVTGPVRKAGGLYRVADDPRVKRRSVPLTEAEDAVVAAVRMAYGVASAQVERSGRLAQRLREAGDRQTGERSDRKAIDATEQLVFRAVMAAVGWLEGLAAEKDSPMKRLVLAQYRILGSILRVDAAEAAQPTAEAAAPPEPAAAARSAPTPRSTDMTIVFRGGVRRPVRNQSLLMTGRGGREGEVVPYDVELFSGQPDPMGALLVFDERGHAAIHLTIAPGTQSGRWRGAVCDGDVQIGIVEIEL
jgi:hypothetical protein